MEVLSGAFTLATQVVDGIVAGMALIPAGSYDYVAIARVRTCKKWTRNGTPLTDISSTAHSWQVLTEAEKPPTMTNGVVYVAHIA